MYKLTLGSINELKYSNTDAYGLFFGTIETDRVVLVNGDGAYLQVDGNFGTSLKNGLVRTYSATRDSAEIAYMIATTNATNTAAVYVYDGIMALQSSYASVDAFIEYLVDNNIITIQGYVSTDWKLDSVSITAAGAGYTQDIVVEIPGGETNGMILCEVDDDEQSATYGTIKTATITRAGVYKTGSIQTADVPGGTTTAKLTVTMTEISNDSDALTMLNMAPKSASGVIEGDDKPDFESKKEPEAQEELEEEKEVVVEPEEKSEPEPAKEELEEVAAVIAAVEEQEEPVVTEESEQEEEPVEE